MVKLGNKVTDYHVPNLKLIEGTLTQQLCYQEIYERRQTIQQIPGMLCAHIIELKFEVGKMPQLRVLTLYTKSGMGPAQHSLTS